MKIFNRKNVTIEPEANLAEMTLKLINDGVVMTDKDGTIQYLNPAAVRMLDCGSAERAMGLDYGLLARIETKEGRELSDEENPLVQAMKTGQVLEPFWCNLVNNKSGKQIPIAVSVLTAESGNRIITFRDITKELEEEGEQTEFISTASHEMRTPVASIEGYLSLALNPQTATVDERARKYLEMAHNASQHLGELFRNLLDITKLDDGKIRVHLVPMEMVEFVGKIVEGCIEQAKKAKLKLTFGTEDTTTLGDERRVEQVVYSSIDESFTKEILNNLIENAIKYTPEGGSIYINVRGDGDRVLINVTDTGIGIPADDLAHIFQKFYRVDNSDTRTIGGTGLGLYIVKQRAEAMGGHVWAESGFGEGTTFYVSLPRITAEEYSKRMIAIENERSMAEVRAAATNQVVSPTRPVQPVAAQSTQPAAAPVQSVQPTVALTGNTAPAQMRPTPQPMQPAPVQPITVQPTAAQSIPTQSAPSMPAQPTINSQPIQMSSIQNNNP